MIKQLLAAATLVLSTATFAHECPDANLIRSDWKMEAMTIHIMGKLFTFEQFLHRYNTEQYWEVGFVVEADNLPAALKKLKSGLNTLRFKGSSTTNGKILCSYESAEKNSFAMAFVSE